MTLEVNLVKCVRVNLVMREKEMGLKRERNNILKSRSMILNGVDLFGRC